MPLDTPAAEVYQADSGGDDADVAADLDDPSVLPREVTDEQDDLGELQGQEHAEDRQVHLRCYMISM